MTTETFCLTTDRLCLRTPSHDDAVALEALAGNERVALTTASIPHPYPKGEAKKRIEFIRQVAGCKCRNLAIFLAHGDEFIGMIGFAGEADTAELTYMISPEHWGRGYATEAAQCLIGHIFEATPFTAITASAMIDNPASEAVLRKIGFEQERVAEVFIPLREVSRAVSFWRLDASKAE